MKAFALRRLRARLAAEPAVSVFVTAFGLWIANGEDSDLLDLQHEAMAEMRAVVTGSG